MRKIVLFLAGAALLAASSRALTTVVPIARTGRPAARAAVTRAAVCSEISYDSAWILCSSTVSLCMG